MSSPVVVHKRGQQQSPAEPATLGEALDALGAALRAAEKHLFELNLGVEASVCLSKIPTTDELGIPIGPDEETRLVWGKRSGQWCLYLTCGMEDDSESWSDSSLLQASIEERKKAAELLPELLRAVRAQSIRQIEEVRAAAERALRFARGEFDNV